VTSHKDIRKTRREEREGIVGLTGRGVAKAVSRKQDTSVGFNYSLSMVIRVGFG
jgi:hypothetical protein